MTLVYQYQFVFSEQCNLKDFPLFYSTSSFHVFYTYFENPKKLSIAASFFKKDKDSDLAQKSNLKKSFSWKSP